MPAAAKSRATKQDADPDQDQDQPVTWEEPPSPARGNVGRTANPREVRLATALYEHPERWAKMDVYDTPSRAASVSQAIGTGRRAAFVQVLAEIQAESGEEGRFEATSRSLPDQLNDDGSPKAAVYVRYTTTPAPERKRRASHKLAEA